MPETAIGSFDYAAHVRNVRRGDWVRLVDDLGTLLAGIRGRVGATGLTADGTAFGIDLVEMQPGSGFPLHVHPGDHVLYVVRGNGSLVVDGSEHPMEAGDTIFIPAEIAHAVRGAGSGRARLVFLAVGQPHRGLAARDRMRVV